MVPPTLRAVHDGSDRALHSHSLSHSSQDKKAAGSPSLLAVPAEAQACLLDKSDRAGQSDRGGGGAGLAGGTLVRRPPRLHEPFVSPEFAGGLERTAHRDADVSRHYRGADGADGGGILSAGSSSSIRDHNDHANHRNSWWEQPEEGHHQQQLMMMPQAAPLYTVRAGDGATRRASNSDVLVALPSPLPPSLKLAKRLAVTAAGCSSVVKSAAATNGGGMAAVLKGTDETREEEFRFNSAEVKATPNALLPEVRVEAGSVTPQQQSRAPCKDLSSLVTEATCSWGQELGKILGQAVPDFVATAAAAVDSGTAMSNSLGRLGLTTTGLFPQTMHLRFSSPVCVASVHVRASSVLRLVVHPGGNVSGSEERGGKAVTVVPVVPLMPVNSIDSRHGGAASEPGGQDIDVDVRGVPSFKTTRSISVTITSGTQPFCSVRRIYALGTQA